MSKQTTSNTKVPRFEDLPDLVTPEEAQIFLRVSRNGIYELIHSRALPSVRFGRLIRIHKSALLGQGR